MASDVIKRRLAAILSADVVGYSRMMSADEESTFDTLRQCRLTIDSAVAEKGGRIVATGGDSVLAEFPSAVEAVRCALDMQTGIAKCNIDLPEERRMRFRIGINLGDVMVSGDDILGDGVNIAARLEQIAEPDSIFISGTVYDQVRNKLDLTYSDLGVRSVKNIDEPVRAYRVSESIEGSAATAAVSPSPVAKNKNTGPTKPTIAVLPFDNMSKDEEQEYFVDGMTEDIITELSRYHDLFVIARNSTFAYKGRAVDVTEVGRELGVRYIVEGSVRKAGNRVRITVQLVDAADGHHLWAERYDRELEDVFAVQDEITQVIVANLPRRVEAAHFEQSKQKPTENMAAYDYVLRAKDHHHRQTPEDNAKAIEMAQKAIELDPDFSLAHAWYSCSLGQAWGRGYIEEKTILRRISKAEKALSDNAKDDAESHRILTELNLVLHRDFNKVRLHQDRAYALNPNDPRIVSQRGETRIWLGQATEAIGWIEKALLLDPSEAERRVKVLGLAHYVARQYQEAIDAFKRTPRLGHMQRAYMAACYAALGNVAEAEAEIALVLKSNPEFSVEAALARAPYELESDREHQRETMLKAGLPV
ncbi:MAG: adenylate/guanylate cyclase domain-containing protein [Proteobacteria bacterium]|nr:adenylate/guanylate cyclase domain-containing protein [Pseudomonadota bacterium]MDA1356032.1 adenylate/guanylate cyclase domain-containing protein [Pseudomonadota bacterium]